MITKTVGYESISPVPHKGIFSKRQKSQMAKKACSSYNIDRVESLADYEARHGP